MGVRSSKLAAASSMPSMSATYLSKMKQEPRSFSIVRSKAWSRHVSFQLTIVSSEFMEEGKLVLVSTTATLASL